MNPHDKGWTEGHQANSEPDFYGKWISVSDRLPESGKWHLIVASSAEGEPMTTMSFFENHGHDGVYWLSHNDGDGEWSGVTHWMSLPEAKC